MPRATLERGFPFYHAARLARGIARTEGKLMASYSATVTDTKYPLGYIKWIEGKRIDAINRAILATGKAWPGLTLPAKMKRGKYYIARYDGWEIEIHKH